MTNELIGIIGVIITMVIGFITFAVQFGGLKKAVGGLESKFEFMCEDFRDLRKSVSDINERLGRVEGNVRSLGENVSMLMGQRIAFSNSPRVLSPAGTDLLDKITGKKIVDQNYTELKDKVKELGDDSRFDIQTSSIEATQWLYKQGKLDGVEEVLFKTGKTNNELYEALGLYLRDKIFEDRGLSLG
jgi:hypothetical protein